MILRNNSFGRSVEGPQPLNDIRATETPETGAAVSQTQVRYEDMTLAEKRRFNFAKARAAKAAKRGE